MSSVAHMKKAAWRFGWLACHLLNVFLACLASFLGGLVFLNWFQQEVPLPDKLAGWVINAAGPDHLKASWSRAVFDLRAGLYLKEFTLFNSNTEQTILTAEETYLKWSPLHVLIQILPALKEVNARNIQIYIPVSHSPSGLNEPVLGIKHLFTHEDSGTVHVSSLLLETGGLRVLLSGEAPLDALLRPESSGEGPQPYTILQSLRRIPEQLQADLTVDWQMLPSGGHVFDLSGFLPEFEYKKIQMKALLGTARIFFSVNGLALRDLALDGTLSYLDDLPDFPMVQLPDDPVPVPFKLSTSGLPWKYRGLEFPSTLYLSLHPADDQLHFQQLLLETTLNDSLDSPVHCILEGPTAFAEGWAYPKSGNEGGGLLALPERYAGRLYLPNCSVEQFLPPPAPHRLLVDARTDSLRLNAVFNFPDLILKGSMVTDGLNIGQTRFDHLFAHLSLSPESLLLDRIRIRKNNIESANGAYFHQFPTSRFSLNAAGTIFPSSLDTILGDWWTDIFTHIEASRPLPADVTVWGSWKDVDGIQSLTEVHGSGASYRGVVIPQLELRVRSNQQWTFLEHLNARFPEGQMSGTIAIRSGLLPGEPYRAHVIDLESDAPWEAVIKASGLERLREMKFTDNPPHVTVKGLLWRDSGQGMKSGEQASLELSLVQHSGNYVLQGLEIEGLTIDGRVEGSRLDLDKVSGRFADGVFTGSIGIDNWQSAEAQSRDIDLYLFDAEFDTAKLQLAHFAGINDFKLASPEEGQGGRLTADITLWTSPDKDKNRGRGRVAVRNSKLGTVHLFGGLSRVLVGMGLGFTTLELDTLNLDWNVNGNQLQVENGLITGPTLKLTLQGQMDLESKALQMHSDVTLFKGVFSKLFSPVSETLQFDLGGTLNAPTWGIRFNPFRWAINRIGGSTEPAKPSN